MHGTFLSRPQIQQSPAYRKKDWYVEKMGFLEEYITLLREEAEKITGKDLMRRGNCYAKQ